MIFANAAWTKITGYDQHEVAGQTFKQLQGPMTNEDAIKDMMADVRSSGYGQCEVVNYTKSGTPYLARIKVQPVLAKWYSEEHYISHYFGIITVAQIGDKESNSMIYSLVNAEEYGWLVKTVENLTASDKGDSSDQRSNNSNNSDNERVGKSKKKRKKRFNSDRGGSETSSQNAAHSGSEAGRTINSSENGGSSHGATSGEGKSDQSNSSRDNSVDGSKSPQSDTEGKSGSDRESDDRERTSSLEDGGSDGGGNTTEGSATTERDGNLSSLKQTAFIKSSTRTGIKRGASLGLEEERETSPSTRSTRSRLH